MRYFIIILFLLLTSSATANRTQSEYLEQRIEHQTFDASSLNDYTKGLNYQPKPKKKEPKKKPSTNTTPSRNNNWDPDIDLDWDWSWDGFSGNLLFWFLITLGLGALVFLLLKITGADEYIFNRAEKVRKRSNEPITIENLEQNIHEAKLDDFLETSLGSEDFKQAIRVYYLMGIKQLSERDIIDWKRDKTNHDYLKEMRKSSFFKDFRGVTRIFERAWYGNTELTEQDFEKVKPKFLAFLEKTNY